MVSRVWPRVKSWVVHPCIAKEVHYRVMRDEGAHLVSIATWDGVLLIERWAFGDDRWVLYVINTRGFACELARGENWQDFPPPVPGDDT